MTTERERELFNALLKAYRNNNDKEGPGLLKAVKAYTGAIEIIHPACSNELIFDFGNYKIKYIV